MVQFDLLPPPLGIPPPPRFAFFFFLGGLFPTPELLIDLIYIFFGTTCFSPINIHFCTIAKRDLLFHNFYKRFLEIIERKIIQLLPRFLKTGLAKKSTHSTTCQLKTMKNHPKARPIDEKP